MSVGAILNRSLLVALVVVLVAALVAGLGLDVVGCGTQPTVSGDQALATAYEERQSGIHVSGAGTIVRVLADDDEGSRHQRFIVALTSGQTLLIAHNIDIAPRVPGLAEGDPVEFSGVYEWNSEGGLIHWTHHDPEGVHRPGWIKHKGTVYE